MFQYDIQKKPQQHSLTFGSQKPQNTFPAFPDSSIKQKISSREPYLRIGSSPYLRHVGILSSAPAAPSSAVQFKADSVPATPTAAPGGGMRASQTGLPSRLQSGMESLSGIALNDVRVYHNSSKPALLGAKAYTKGSDIHLGAHQEQHLPHEAWHVVQQKQGRVKSEMQFKGQAVNVDSELEKEADRMGELALTTQADHTLTPVQKSIHNPMVQGFGIIKNEKEVKDFKALIDHEMEDQEEVNKHSSVQNLKKELEESQKQENAALSEEENKGSKEGDKKQTSNKDEEEEKQEPLPPFTTVGFEYEFAEMAPETKSIVKKIGNLFTSDKKADLRGVTHLKIAKSEKNFPFTNIPFWLETDTGNKLELVTPPFLVRTIDSNRPIPQYKAISSISTIMESYFSKLEFDKKGTIEAMLKDLEEKSGIRLIISDKIKIGRESLTHNTTKNVGEIKDEISAKSIGEIGIKDISLINTQLNFATDALTYHKLRNNDDLDKKNWKPFVDVEKKLNKSVTDNSDQPESSKIFAAELAKTLASLIVLPSLNAVEKFQKAEYEDQKAGEYDSETRKKIKDSKNRKERYDFMSHTFMGTWVKDVKFVWLKDTLISFAIGLFDFSQDNQVQVFAGIIEKFKIAVDDLEISEFVKNHKWHEDESLNNAMTEVIKNNLKNIKQKMTEVLNILKDTENLKETYLKTNKRATEFMSHNEKAINARQDTFLDPNLVNIIPHWKENKKRLHVIEWRGDGKDALAEKLKQLLKPN